MTTMSSIRVAGKASAGQGSNGADGSNGRLGLRAKLAAGVAVLGCAAALLPGGMRAEHAAQSQARLSPPVTHLPAGTDDLATNGCVGTAGPFACQAGPSLAGTDDVAPI